MSNINKKENVTPFNALMFFTFVLYIAPQHYIVSLQSLHLAKVSSIVAILTYLFSRGSRVGPIIKLDLEVRLILILIFLAIISIPMSIWPGGSFGVLKDRFLKAIIIFLLIAHVLTSAERLKKMLWFIIFLCAIISIIAIKDYFAGAFYKGGRIFGAGAPITANPNDLALTVALLIPFALSFISMEKGLKKILGVIYIILATAAVICTFSRGGFILLVVIYGVLCLKMFRKSGVLSILLAIVFMGFIFFLTPEDYIDRLVSITDFAKDSTGSAIGRERQVYVAMSLLSKNPLLGVGLGMNILALNESSVFSWEKIHNVYLEIAVDMGIPAGIVFIILLYTLIKNMRVIQKETERLTANSEMKYLAQGVEISLIAFAVGALFHPVAYNFYFYYIAGFAVALKRIFMKNNNTNNIEI